MGEESKEATEEKKKEGNKEAEEEEKVVLKVDMHCDACAKKVFRALTTFPGVEDVAIDRKASTVTVKGKAADPLKLCERIFKKSGRKPQIVSAPSPKPPPPDQQQQPLPPKDKDDDNSKDGVVINKLDQPPPVVTVVLRVQMHCEACAHILRKRIQKMKGVESVETDVGKDQVTVKGVIADPGSLVEYVYKRTRKQASIVVKADDQDQKKQEAAAKTTNDDKQGEAKNESSNSSSQGNEKQDNINDDALRSQVMNNRYEYYWPTRYSYMDYNSYNYQPQFFSDENPNACSLM